MGWWFRWGSVSDLQIQQKITYDTFNEILGDNNKSMKYLILVHVRSCLLNALLCFSIVAHIYPLSIRLSLFRRPDLYHFVFHSKVGNSLSGLIIQYLYVRYHPMWPLYCILSHSPSYMHEKTHFSHLSFYCCLLTAICAIGGMYVSTYLQ